MTIFVYYKTPQKVRTYIVTSMDEMWEKIDLVRKKGHIVTEVNIFDTRQSDYVLKTTPNGKDLLIGFGKSEGERIERSEEV